MLYHLFDWLSQGGIKVPGGGLFQFITFRALMAILLSLVITMIYGKRIINLLKRKQIGESVRELGLAGESQKKGTPTMGGIIILLGILIPTHHVGIVGNSVVGSCGFFGRLPQTKSQTP
jgi:phospho-N-acetylmuramoyl-pentapeptide-transferase